MGREHAFWKGVLRSRGIGLYAGQRVGEGAAATGVTARKGSADTGSGCHGHSNVGMDRTHRPCWGGWGSRSGSSSSGSIVCREGILVVRVGGEVHGYGCRGRPGGVGESYSIRQSPGIVTAIHAPAGVARSEGRCEASAAVLGVCNVCNEATWRRGTHEAPLATVARGRGSASRWIRFGSTRFETKQIPGFNDGRTAQLSL